LKQQQKLQQQIDELEKELKAIDPDPIKEVAHAIHRTICRKRHDDDCSFYYDTWDNPSGQRQKYIKQAIAMLKWAHKDAILSILDILEV
jgi:hypothetical protein